MIYALDTNIVSYYLKGLYRIDEKFDEILAAGNCIVIPPITLYETLRGLLAVKAMVKLDIFGSICRQLGLKEMELSDWVQAAKLYAELKEQGQPMHDSDLLQAAFCLNNKYTLVTHNLKHFSHIRALLVVDWVE